LLKCVISVSDQLVELLVYKMTTLVND